MKSLLGRISPYVRSLELRVEAADERAAKLLDRILLITTGAPLIIPPALEEAALAGRELENDIKRGRKDLIDKTRRAVGGDEPFLPGSLAEHMRDLEARSFEESVDGTLANFTAESRPVSEEAVVARETSLKGQFREDVARAQAAAAGPVVD